MGSRPPAGSAGTPTRRWPAVLGGAFALQWVWWGWAPWYRADWALENVLTLAVAWWLLRRHRTRPFSDASYLLLFLFASAHMLGAHYTYSEVPYAAWAGAVFGEPAGQWLGEGRNHYDRVVHFLFGVLCYRPLREWLAPAILSAGAARALPVALVATFSLSYELLEWLAALVFGGDLGQAYLGTQGDVWDSQKDSALALLGAALAALRPGALPGTPLRG